MFHSADGWRRPPSSTEPNTRLVFLLKRQQQRGFCCVAFSPEQLPGGVAAGGAALVRSHTDAVAYQSAIYRLAMTAAGAN